ncbi:hexamethylene bisacetamide inducible [Rhynchophorus ferrugineus]|uniref:Uncharacterized protein n=1 Tax=Rhynchophorus ferrugineus TaxID=354439 RepID=A0A834HP75_RHYFE|nr:hypothetical protein GWI33_021386 [Rhynchophorus ferrugineus]
MSENINQMPVEKPGSDTVDASLFDVVQQNGARALVADVAEPMLPDNDVPAKKRKTRRGKSKRKTPYQKYGRVARKNTKMTKPRIVKPEAPRNDNQFLLEDHGGFEELDERLKCIDQASTSTVTRTRDSSFSVDSDCEFYSSPDDEGEFLMKDFNDQYQSVQTEQLQTMSKQELIDEYLSLDNRFSQKYRDLEDTIKHLEKELEKHKDDKESLERENALLKSKLEEAGNDDTDSEDSETDSSESCSSSSSSNSHSDSSRSTSPVLEENMDFVKANGHASPTASVGPV